MTGTAAADSGTGARVFRIETIGPCARPAFQNGARGEIGAVFERSFYVVIGGQWICLVPKDGGAGPLNAACAERSLGRIGDLRIGGRVSVENGLLAAGRISFSFAGAAGWQPELPREGDRQDLRRGLGHLREIMLRYEIPRDGLASLLNGEPGSATARAAEKPLQALRKSIGIAIAGGDVPDAAPLVPLLGLGPGLTPSGDDAIGGALIALHLLNEDRARDLLWAKLQPHARPATGDISLAHLFAAARGFGHEAVHRLANAVIEGDGADMRGKVDAVNAIGHTSGWDALVGIVAALESRLEPA